MMGPRQMHRPPRRLETRHSAEMELEETGTSVVASGAPACLKTARLNERDDDYPLVLCRLNHRWRIIDCRDSIQWVLQRRAGHLNGRPRWDGNAYCRSRAGLLANIKERAGDADPSALAVIKALPERHE